MTGPVLIGSEIYRGSSYGRNHPLSIPRVSLVLDLCRALGWVPDDHYVDSPMASVAELQRFHTADYIAAVQRIERDGKASAADRETYNIGYMENPVFPEMFHRPATACGGSLKGAELAAAGQVAFNPAGGLHHGQPGKASGFCFFNDPVLAILRLRDLGLRRITYVDVDAHHGDGVEAAFAADADVLTVSVHEQGRWPFSGTESNPDRGVFNLPVPKGLNDDEFAYVIEQAVLPVVTAFKPKAIVMQCGADALKDDPLSKLSLSNRAIWSAVQAVSGLTGVLLVLGGGGYNPWSVARCWAGIWGTLMGFDTDIDLNDAGRDLLHAVEWRHSLGRNPQKSWFRTLADAPRNGPLRHQVRDIARMNAYA